MQDSGHFIRENYRRRMLLPGAVVVCMLFVMAGVTRAKDVGSVDRERMISLQVNATLITDGMQCRALAAKYVSARDFERAVEMYERLLVLEPDNRRTIQMVLGRLYVRAGQLHKADLLAYELASDPFAQDIFVSRMKPVSRERKQLSKHW